MKFNLIYSRTDEHLIHIFKNYTRPLVVDGTVEFVSENAERSLIFFSPSLVKDVFCYQHFLTAKYFNRPIKPILLQYWDGYTYNKDFNQMIKTVDQSKNIPEVGNYLYNTDGTFRSLKYRSPDQAWGLVVEGLQNFIEKE